MKSLNIIAHSSYDNLAVSSLTDNVSSITDKLVRLAAKNTESYAGDIVYDINRLSDDVANGRSRVELLCFRDSGIDTYDITDVADLTVTPMPAFNTLKMPSCFEDRLTVPEYIQCWLLESYLNEAKNSRLTKLNRVDISFR